MLESAIKKKILKQLRENYPQGVWYKIHGGPTQERGIPDIIGCLKGRFIAFEIKRPGKFFNHPTAYQKFQIDSIKKAKGVVAVVTSYEGVKFILSRL